jgi:hypothetical protein
LTSGRDYRAFEPGEEGEVMSWHFMYVAFIEIAHSPGDTKDVDELKRQLTEAIWNTRFAGRAEGYKIAGVKIDFIPEGSLPQRERSR